MKKRYKKLDLVSLGWALGKLEWVGNDNPASVREPLDRLWAAIRDMPKMAPETGILEQLRKELVPQLESNRLDTKFCRSLAEAVKRIQLDLAKRWTGQEVIVAEKHDVITKLHVLRDHVVHESQRGMVDETIACVEVGAPRAAVVMAWNLTYDHIRRWIFVSKRGRLPKFNAKLSARNKSPTVKHDPIVEYEDFEQHKESLVLDLAYEAKLYPKYINQLLGNGLTDRNHLAHPNSRQANLTSAIGYIENFMLNVLYNEMFRYGRIRE